MPNKFLPPTTNSATRTAVTPLDGELLYDTDEKKLYSGDGITLGGVAITSTDTLTDKSLYYYDASSKLLKPIPIGTLDQVLVAKPSLNPPYQFATVNGTGGREILTSNRTYYVRTDGSDSNNGLVNTSGGAFLTIQKFFDVLVTLDKNGFNVTCQVADGTYTLTSDITVKDGIGQGKVILIGNTTTPSNVTITSSNNLRYINKSIEGTLEVKGFRFINTGTGTEVCFLFVSNGVVAISNLDFGSTGSGSPLSQTHMNVSAKGIIHLIGNYTISGSSPYHQLVLSNGIIRDFLGYDSTLSPITVTLTGSPSFAVFLLVSHGGIYDVYYLRQTFTGSATGTRYLSNRLGGIFTFGGGANYIPGNSAGSTSLGGIYE